MGWSRDRARDYSGCTRRGSRWPKSISYIAWPGQALAYKMGELKITELRRRAEQALGARFDIKVFHDVVLWSGRQLLDLLEEQVNDYIASAKAVPTSRRAESRRRRRCPCAAPRRPVWSPESTDPRQFYGNRRFGCILGGTEVPDEEFRAFFRTNPRKARLRFWLERHRVLCQEEPRYEALPGCSACGGRDVCGRTGASRHHCSPPFTSKTRV